jgi:CcmD family protein
VSTGSQYVVAAYAVIWFVLLVWVIYAGARMARISREIELLTKIVERQKP